MGEVIKLDQHTLLRQKGRFARVCVNIHITKPLRGSLKLTNAPHMFEVPLIYEGLHEVCALCGSDAHALEACPNYPVQAKIEVVVEKFGSHSLACPNSTSLLSTTAQGTSPVAERWIRVAPKKRVRPLSKVQGGNSGSS